MSERDVVYGFIRELAAEQGVETVARRGLTYLRRAAGVPAGALFLHDERLGEVRLVASHGLPLALLRHLSHRTVDPRQPDPVSRTVLERRPLLSGSPEVEFLALCEGDELTARRFGARALVPLVIADRVLGVVELFAPAGTDLAAAGYADFRVLCDILAVVLDKNQLVEERDRCLQVSRTFFDLSRAVLPVVDVAELRPKIVESATHLLGGSSGCLAVWQSDRRTLSLQAALNLPEEFARQPLDPEETALGRVVAENQPVVVQAYDAWEGADELLAGAGIVSLVAVPMRLEEGAAGVLMVGASRTAVRFTPEDAGMLKSFADSAAVALANASLFRQIRLKADQTAALLKISHRLAESLKLDSVLTSVLQEAAFFLGATAGSLHLAPAPEARPEVAATCGSEEHLASAAELAERAMADGQPVTGGDGARTFLAVPLVTGTKRLGALTCLREGPDAFSEDDVAFLWALAGHAAMAIENARLHEEAEERSVRDALTGLYNVRQLQARLSEEVLRAERYGRELSFLMLDIDHFKRYNDTYGHLQGDRVLRRVADVVTQSVRTVDQVFRYGGEEICVLLPETPPSQAVLVAERIRLAVAGLVLGGEGDQGLGRVTVSVGVASFPTDAAAPRELVARADEALYRAKAAGRNRVQSSTVTTSSTGLRGR